MKQDLLNILKDPNDKLIAVDLDGVLCECEFWGEGEPVPIPKTIDMVRGWYNAGGHIIIYTSRQPKFYQATQSWLVKYGVPFHGIAMQVKIGADLYIDDKALNVEDI